MADKLERVIGTDSLKKYFDSPYMGAYSISDSAEPIVTIAEVQYGKITLDGGRKEEHIILQFREHNVSGMGEVKPLVLNATNQKALEKLYGKGADPLIGKKIQFYIDPAVKAIGGGTTEGVRIRPFKPKEAEPIPPCTDCGKEIQPAMGKTAAWMAAYTTKHYSVPLCAECAQKRKDAQTQAAEEAEPLETEDDADARSTDE